MMQKCTWDYSGKPISLGDCETQISELVWLLVAYLHEVQWGAEHLFIVFHERRVYVEYG